MYPHSHPGPGQIPNQWSPPPPNSSQPPNGAYPPPPASQTQLPPISAAHPDMASVHQQPHPGYRLPAPHEMNYRGPHPPDPFGRPPQYMAHPPHQPAPRQRTAIACRYCRRRKIRCSGFDASDDGRCTNCVRFSQECVFTPVSAQTQAFVPAHTVWRGGTAPPALYGAYGQPLPPQQTQQYLAQGGPSRQDYALPSPTGPYPPAGAYPPPPGPYDERRSLDGGSRKRPTAEPHTPTLPPPNPAAQAQLPGSRGSDHPSQGYTYPEPPSLTTTAADSPASSTASYPGQQQTPYYTTQPPTARRSPQSSAYPYAPSPRASSSPHNPAAPGTPGNPNSAYPYPPEQRPANLTASLPIRHDGRTPPPPHANAPPTTNGVHNSQPPPGQTRPMSISNVLSTAGGNSGTSAVAGAQADNGGGRSAADSQMLNRLR